jgi:hypothetical protein
MSRCDAPASAARPAGWCFSPLDERLRLGTEGYSPAVLKKILHAAASGAFKEASANLSALAGLSVSSSHLQRLALRLGTEWAGHRDAAVQAFQNQQLAVAYQAAPQVASVMLDGGRLQTRADDQGRGVTDPQWREFKAANLETLRSAVRTEDPQPQPPARYRDKEQVARLATELKSARGAAPARPSGTPPRRRRRQRRGRLPRPRKVVRTVLASMANSDRFGWQVAAEVQRRGLHQAKRKAYVCDGQKYNWSIWEMHLVMLGFVPILDFLHLLVYLYAAACAAQGKGTEAAWALYEGWLGLAWSGQVSLLVKGLRAAGERVGRPPPGAKDEDPRKVVWEAVGYVENNRDKMKYPEYRQLGLPISSAGVESVIKQLNRRVKGTEKFWQEGGAEALLQLRAARLSEDGRMERYGELPRPRGRAVGTGRLGRS